MKTENQTKIFGMGKILDTETEPIVPGSRFSEMTKSFGFRATLVLGQTQFHRSPNFTETQFHPDEFPKTSMVEIFVHGER